MCVLQVKTCCQCAAALGKLRAELTPEGAATFLGALLTADAAFSVLLALWRSSAAQQSTRTGAALLHTLSVLFSIPAGSLPLSVLTASHALARTLLTAHMKPVYFHLSSDEHSKANHSLAFLTSAVALSSEHTLAFISSFDFSLAAWPKLAVPPAAQRKPQGDHSASKRWTSSKLSKRPTRACFVELATACLLAADDKAAVAAVCAAPSLLGLVLAHISKDPPEVAARVCTALLQRVLAPGVLRPSHPNSPGHNCKSVRSVCVSGRTGVQGSRLGWHPWLRCSARGTCTNSLQLPRLAQPVRVLTPQTLLTHC